MDSGSRDTSRRPGPSKSPAGDPSNKSPGATKKMLLSRYKSEMVTDRTALFTASDELSPMKPGEGKNPISLKKSDKPSLGLAVTVKEASSHQRNVDNKQKSHRKHVKKLKKPEETIVRTPATEAQHSLADKKRTVIDNQSTPVDNLTVSPIEISLSQQSGSSALSGADEYCMRPATPRKVEETDSTDSQRSLKYKLKLTKSKKSTKSKSKLAVIPKSGGDSSSPSKMNDVGNSPSKKVPKKSPKPTDQPIPNIPKKPKMFMSGYFHWVTHFKKQLKGQYASMKQVCTAAAEQWRQMTEADRAPYQKKSEADKERYAAEMEEYNKAITKLGMPPAEVKKYGKKKTKKKPNPKDPAGQEELSARVVGTITLTRAEQGLLVPKEEPADGLPLQDGLPLKEGLPLPDGLLMAGGPPSQSATAALFMSPEANSDLSDSAVSDGSKKKSRNAVKDLKFDGCACAIGQKRIKPSKVTYKTNQKQPGTHYHCQCCSFITEYFGSMVRHEATKHDIMRPGLQTFRCKLCNKVTIHLSEYARHLYKHQSANPDSQEFKYAVQELLRCADMGIKMKNEFAKIFDIPVKYKGAKDELLKKALATKKILQQKHKEKGTETGVLNTKMKAASKVTKSARQVAVKRIRSRPLKVRPSEPPPRSDSISDPGSDIQGFFRCRMCAFESNSEETMLRHCEDVHKKGSDGKTYDCEPCAFETTSCEDFKVHCESMSHLAGVEKLEEKPPDRDVDRDVIPNRDVDRDVTPNRDVDMDIKIEPDVMTEENLEKHEITQVLDEQKTVVNARKLTENMSEDSLVNQSDMEKRSVQKIQNNSSVVAPMPKKKRSVARKSTTPRIGKKLSDVESSCDDSSAKSFRRKSSTDFHTPLAKLQRVGEGTVSAVRPSVYIDRADDEFYPRRNSTSSSVSAVLTEIKTEPVDDDSADIQPEGLYALLARGRLPDNATYHEDSNTSEESSDTIDNNDHVTSSVLGSDLGEKSLGGLPSSVHDSRQSQSRVSTPISPQVEAPVSTDHPMTTDPPSTNVGPVVTTESSQTISGLTHVSDQQRTITSSGAQPAVPVSALNTQQVSAPQHIIPVSTSTIQHVSAPQHAVPVSALNIQQMSAPQHIVPVSTSTIQQVSPPQPAVPVSISTIQQVSAPQKVVPVRALNTQQVSALPTSSSWQQTVPVNTSTTQQVSAPQPAVSVSTSTTQQMSVPAIGSIQKGYGLYPAMKPPSPTRTSHQSEGLQQTLLAQNAHSNISRTSNPVCDQQVAALTASNQKPAEFPVQSQHRSGTTKLKEHHHPTGSQFSTESVQRVSHPPDRIPGNTQWPASSQNTQTYKAGSTPGSTAPQMTGNQLNPDFLGRVSQVSAPYTGYVAPQAQVSAPSIQQMAALNKFRTGRATLPANHSHVSQQQTSVGRDQSGLITGDIWQVSQSSNADRNPRIATDKRGVQSTPRSEGSDIVTQYDELPEISVVIMPPVTGTYHAGNSAAAGANIDTHPPINSVDGLYGALHSTSSVHQASSVSKPTCLSNSPATMSNIPASTPQNTSQSAGFSGKPQNSSQNPHIASKVRNTLNTSGNQQMAAPPNPIMQYGHVQPTTLSKSRPMPNINQTVPKLQSTLSNLLVSNPTPLQRIHNDGSTALTSSVSGFQGQTTRPGVISANVKNQNNLSKSRNSKKPRSSCTNPQQNNPQQNHPSVNQAPIPQQHNLNVNKAPNPQQHNPSVNKMPISQHYNPSVNKTAIPQQYNPNVNKTPIPQQYNPNMNKASNPQQRNSNVNKASNPQQRNSNVKKSSNPQQHNSDVNKASNPQQHNPSVNKASNPQQYNLNVNKALNPQQHNPNVNKASNPQQHNPNVNKASNPQHYNPSVNKASITEVVNLCDDEDDEIMKIAEMPTPPKPPLPLPTTNLSMNVTQASKHVVNLGAPQASKLVGNVKVAHASKHVDNSKAPQASKHVGNVKVAHASKHVDKLKAPQASQHVGNVEVSRASKPGSKAKVVHGSKHVDTAAESDDDCYIEDVTNLNADTGLRDRRRDSRSDGEMSALTPMSLDQVRTSDLFAELQSRNRLFSCVCGMLFIEESLFKVHQAIHVPGQPFMCATCNFMAKDWHSFIIHISQHS